MRYKIDRRCDIGLTRNGARQCSQGHVILSLFIYFLHLFLYSAQARGPYKNYEVTYYQKQ